MPDTEYTRESCLELLLRKSDELASRGDSRFPQRGDFTERELVAIKAFLGPMPRALEAAGLKAPRFDEHREKTLEKRIRSRRRKTEAKKRTLSE